MIKTNTNNPITTQAIVIDKQDYNDFDNIVTVFSKEFGKISFISLGTRKTKSKNKPSIELFSLSEFEIFKAKPKALSKLKTGRTIDSHYEISKKYFNYIIASISLDLIDWAFRKDNQLNEAFFDNFKILLESLNKNQAPLKVFCWFFYWELKFLGYEMQTKFCLYCEQKVRNSRYFHKYKFQVVCEQCYRKNFRILENKLINSLDFFKLINDLNILKINELDYYFIEFASMINLLKILMSYSQKILQWNSISFDEFNKTDFLNI